MNIQYNQNVITHLKGQGFFPDTMFAAVFALQALHSGDVTLLDAVDDYSTSKRMILVYMDLERRGLIRPATEEEKTHYVLTDNGTEFIKNVEKLSNQATTDDTAEWIQQWVELFPKGVKSGGKLLRSDAKSCLIKMRKFRKDYPAFSKEVIFNATLKYLRQKELQNWDFTRCAVYFIHKKDEGSDLAAWCDDLVNKTVEEIKTETRINNNFTGLV